MNTENPSESAVINNSGNFHANRDKRLLVTPKGEYRIYCKRVV
jgi:hypothetical protein